MSNDTNRVGDEAASAAEPGKPNHAQPAQKKPRKRATIVVAVIGVLVVLGVAMGIWHEQPSFCTAICHTPMNSEYLQTLEADPTQPAVDKWGNHVEVAGAMMASLHGDKDIKCMGCHVPSIEEQVTEGILWVKGDYVFPLSERDLSRLVYYRGVGETEFCLNSGCHDMTKADLTKKTESYARNPHSWHHNEYTCSDCHKGHRASIVVCTQCHDDAQTPTGWLTYKESKQLEHQYMSYNEELFLAQNS